jgi:hypothetical protein
MRWRVFNFKFLSLLTFSLLLIWAGAPVRTLLVLDDDACPAELQACYPRGGSRFSIQMRRGGLVRVHDSVLMPNVILIKHICVRMTRVSITLFSYVQSQYKSLLISERTTIDDLIELLLRCHSNNERIERFSIYEVNIHIRTVLIFLCTDRPFFDFDLFKIHF